MINKNIFKYRNPNDFWVRARAGLHFVEDAERTIPQRLSQMADYLPEFTLYLLDLETTYKDFSIVQNWTSSHVTLAKGPLDAHAVAIDIAYGLPF